MKSFRESYLKEGNRGASLAKNMTMIIVLSVVLISGASLSVFFFTTSRNHQTQNEQEQAQYVAFLIDSLQLPLWNFDSTAVKKIGQTMMEVQRLSFLSIKDAKGKQIFVKGHLESMLIPVRFMISVFVIGL